MESNGTLPKTNQRLLAIAAIIVVLVHVASIITAVAAAFNTKILWSHHLIDLFPYAKDNSIFNIINVSLLRLFTGALPSVLVYMIFVVILEPYLTKGKNSMKTAIRVAAKEFLASYFNPSRIFTKRDK